MRPALRCFALAVAVGTAGCASLHPLPDDRPDTFVVAPGGDDRAAGTEGAPWSTLERAARQVGPGDVVLVRPGRYDGFTLETSGAAGAPIRFLADDGAVIEDPSSRDGINLEGASHVEIRGFTITGAPRAGIRAVECTDVAVRANRADHNGKWGIFTGFCEGVVIEDNETSRSKEQHGIYVSNSADEPTIRRNRSWGNAASGIQLNGDVNMGKGDGIISGAVIEGNVVYGNGRRGGAAINLDGIQDASIVNNLLYDNAASGIALFRIDGGGPSSGNLIAHNTVVMPVRARWALLLRDGAADNTVVNNIFVNQHPRRGAIDASPDSLDGLVADHNLVTDRFTLDDGRSAISLTRWRDRTGTDRRSVAAPALTRLFAAIDGHDFRPAPDSPALDGAAADIRRGPDAAIPLPATDIEGNERPQGNAPDIGAYERQDGDVPTARAATESNRSPL